MNRTIVRAVLMSAAVAIGGGVGCKSKPQPSGSVITSNLGSAVYGTFVQKSEAKFDPETPFVGMNALGDSVYLYTKANRVYGLSDGLDIRFIRQVVSPQEQLRPAVSLNDELIFPSSVGMVVLSKDGAPLRTLRLQNPITSNVRVDLKGRLLSGVASQTGGRLSIIDPQKADYPTLQETLVGNISSAPDSFQGITFAATDAGRVYAIAGENKTAWSMEGLGFDTGRPIRADLIVDDYAVFVASTDSALYALDRSNGKIRWRYMAQVPLTQTPKLTANRVYQVVPGKGLAAIDKIEGKLYREPLWFADGVTKVVSVDDKYVYAVRNNDQLVALGVGDGEVKFSATGQFDFVTAAANGTIFAATKTGGVVSLQRGTYTGENIAAR